MFFEEGSDVSLVSRHRNHIAFGFDVTLLRRCAALCCIKRESGWILAPSSAHSFLACCELSAGTGSAVDGSMHRL